MYSAIYKTRVGGLRVYKDIEQQSQQWLFTENQNAALRIFIIFWTPPPLLGSPGGQIVNFVKILTFLVRFGGQFDPLNHPPNRCKCI